MSNILACYQLLELNIISAQDLAPVGRSMRTYAVAWIDPDRKLSTRVDSEGGTNPAWNDKFVFRIDQDFLYDEEAAIVIDIYALHWFRDIHVGTAHVLIDDLIPPPSQPFRNTCKSTGMRFVGLQVLRSSGQPKGILNVGVGIIDSSMRSMPLYTHDNTSAVGYSHDDHNPPSHQAKPHLRRIKSDTSSILASEAMAHEQPTMATKGKANSQVTLSEVSVECENKAYSTLSGSDVMAMPEGGFGIKKRELTTHDSPRVNVDYEVKPSPKREFQNSPYNNAYKGGVRATPLHAFAMTNAALEYGTPYRSNMGRAIMTNSELGPSASEVAAAVARQPIEEGENSTVGGWSLDESVEGLQPKVERWHTELPPVYDGGEMSSLKSSGKKGKHSRRHTDGGSGNGLFSCFSVICGVECSIVCGSGGKKSRRRRAQSVDNQSFL
ncbi:uncharacterized protein LOC113871536 [Abrus precatorius]|uniref:Uncharacterized protein LOC113871536 n=1 Tax=Abrus precatorius TaxID=3816 RepID=A0A8B8MBF8_ABRPR|nr:uncharacterized protein LOC113871536 [Abrus precatorius]